MAIQTDDSAAGVHLLLVAPLAGEGDLTSMAPMWFQEAERIASSGGFILRTRNVYQPAELWQTWRALPSDPDHPGVLRAWHVEVKYLSFLVAIVQVPRSPQADVIAEAANEVAADLCERMPGFGSWRPEWVSRCILLPDPMVSEEFVGWLDLDAITLPVADDPTHPLMVSVGWGNNLVRGWDPEQELPVKGELAMGLVDAQFLWMEVFATAKASAKIAHQVIEQPASLSRRQFARHIAELDKMSDAIALHQLNYDDLLTNIQGARRDVARACLATWGYEEVFERVNQRLPMVTIVTEREAARASRRFQGVVQGILAAIGFLAVGDFLLTLYGEALAANPDAAADPSLVLGVMKSMRVDWLLGLTALLALVTIIISRFAKGVRP